MSSNRQEFHYTQEFDEEKDVICTSDILGESLVEGKSYAVYVGVCSTLVVGTVKWTVNLLTRWEMEGSSVALMYV